MELKRSKDTFKLNYQYRIVPDKQQVYQLTEWLYKLCQIHNLMLKERFNWWECNRTPVNACPIFITHLPELKDQPNYYSQKRATHWSRESHNLMYQGVHSQVIQEAIKRVEDTFNRFIKGDLNGKRSGKPRLKSVRRYRTLSIPQLKADCLSVTVNPHRRKNGGTRRDIAYINLPKVGQVKLIYHRPIPEGFAIKAALVSRRADGWYICCWGQFLSIIAYKAAKAGKAVVKVKPHNTSQVCSCCNLVEQKDLSVRIHHCLCGFVLDRDWNAAININRVGSCIFPTIKRRKRSCKAAMKEAYTEPSRSVPVGERVGGCHYFSLGLIE